MPTDLLRNKSQPEASADGVVEWVKSEREMRERLKREKEAKEAKEKLDVCIESHFSQTQLDFDCSERRGRNRQQKRRSSRRRNKSLRS
jgi:hypothetical protein